MIAVTSSTITTSTTDDEHDDGAMDFRGSHGKVYATRRTEHICCVVKVFRVFVVLKEGTNLNLKLPRLDNTLDTL